MRIAVIGGGLGGLPAAIMLEGAGHDVTVYEQAPRLERVGAGIHLYPNAVKVLRRIGMLERLASVGLQADQFLQREWDTGEVTYDIRLGSFKERYGVPHLVLHRGVLVEEMASALAPGTLQLAKRLVGLEDEGATVSLVFADGSRADADMVIGADGINSKIREMLIGPEKPTYTGQVAHRSIFPASRLGELRLADATKWWAEESYFLAYYLSAARDEVYFVTGVPQPWEGDDFAPVPTDMDQLHETFEGFHPEVRAIIEACPECMTWPALLRDPQPLWSTGRVVALGDACHPMKPHMGQGAAMAMEDAAVLVRCIAHCGADDPAAAFALYQKIRYERTKRVKLESDKHEWMRYGDDADWLYGYDAVEVPLTAA